MAQKTAFHFVLERKRWLTASDEDLMKECRFQPFKATGPGGQHRNKVSSAVRLEHLPTGLTVTANGSRHQHQNRHDALKKLRHRIAMEVRCDDSQEPIDLNVSVSATRYPSFLATLLDVLALHEYDLKRSADRLGISPSRLAKILYRDPDLWQEVNRIRVEKNLTPLHRP